MTENTDENYWAQLVSVTDIETSPILISKNKFVVGRNEDCDLSFGGNKLVSGKHCFLEKSDGKVLLYDTSTNGTLLNMKTKVSKGDSHELKHGDEVYIVYKKNAMEQNIGYLFQEKEMLDKEDEEESTQDYSYEADMTLADDSVNHPNESGSDGVDSKHSLKRKIQHGEGEEFDGEGEESDGEGEESDQKKKKESDEKVNKPESSGVDVKKASTSKVDDNDDDMLDTLTCIICQDILHDCISLQPCMHSFCAGCYSEWMEKSNQCPSCRMKVDRINKNHLVNNLVEAFLKARPEKKRSEDDLKERDEKNKITRDMLYPDMTPSGIGDDSCSLSGSDSGTEDEDEEDASTSYNPAPFLNINMNMPGVVHGFGTPFFGTMPARPNVPVCRQCPTYTTPAGILPPAPQADPNDEDAKTFPAVPDYTCQRNQNHVLCLCCLQPMPDRRREYRDGGTVPPQQCSLCFRSFCHAYWGCRIDNCNGCMGKFKDLNFGKKCLTSVILDNPYESRVLKDYLESKDMSVKNLLAECLAKIVTGEYRCINQERLTNGINTPVCYACGFLMFKDLAYAYRKGISDDELPREVTRRPDCYWGRNCRTQRNKPEHAQKFNHICEQSRTA